MIPGINATISHFVCACFQAQLEPSFDGCFVVFSLPVCIDYKTVQETSRGRPKWGENAPTPHPHLPHVVTGSADPIPGTASTADKAGR